MAIILQEELLICNSNEDVSSITMEQVSNAIQSLNNYKSAGSDDITSDLLKGA